MDVETPHLDRVLWPAGLRGMSAGDFKIRSMILPNIFLDDDKPQLQYAAAILQARHSWPPRSTRWSKSQP